MRHAYGVIIVEGLRNSAEAAGRNPRATPDRDPPRVASDAAVGVSTPVIGA
jgi:hypothetical protein